MEPADALKIIRQLADGIDPQTGRALHADSPYQHPDTVRALFVAARALEAPPAAVRAENKEPAPQKAGKPWSDEEDHALAAAFDAGGKIPELAAQHQRSRFAIEARLAKLGKIEPPANLRGYRAASGTAAYAVQH